MLHIASRINHDNYVYYYTDVQVKIVSNVSLNHNRNALSVNVSFETIDNDMNELEGTLEEVNIHNKVQIPYPWFKFNRLCIRDPLLEYPINYSDDNYNQAISKFDQCCLNIVKQIASNITCLELNGTVDNINEFFRRFGKCNFGKVSHLQFKIQQSATNNQRLILNESMFDMSCGKNINNNVNGRKFITNGLNLFNLETLLLHRVTRFQTRDFFDDMTCLAANRSMNLKIIKTINAELRINKIVKKKNELLLFPNVKILNFYYYQTLVNNFSLMYL